MKEKYTCFCMHHKKHHIMSNDNNNNNNNKLIYIAPYAELQRRWATVNQAAENRNVFRCFLKTESELQSKMFDGRLFQITGAK